jgi:diguanylate cyclase (GGDEF)-like protein/PAS domain S-box-containing protein
MVGSADHHVVDDDAPVLVPDDPADLARFAAHHTPDVLVVVDPAGIIRWGSVSADRVLGITPEIQRGRPIWDFVHPDDLVAAAGAVSEASRSTGYHQPTVFRVRHEGGEWVECEVSSVTVEGRHELTGEEGTWLVLSVRPTGDRDLLMGRRRRIEQLIRLASLECSSAPSEGVASIVERYLEDLATVVGAELIELAWEEQPGDLRIGARWPVVRVGSIATPTAQQFVPLWPVADSAARLLSFSADLEDLEPTSARDRLVHLGSVAAVEVPLTPRAPWAVLRLAFGQQWQLWDDANVDLVIVLASTLMATLRRSEAEAHLHEQARTDPLTGLLNRSELYRRFEQLLAARPRMGACPTGVLFCDLDHFKLVNDSQGHNTGDEVLVGVARVLAEQTRDVDLVARVGGDEFVVVCPDLCEADALELLVDRIGREIDRLAPGGVPVRLSIGAVCSDGELDVDQLISAADEAMYRVKRARRAESESSSVS